MDDFEIIISPHKKWKRLALLLESETIDKCKQENEDLTLSTNTQLVKYTHYNTFSMPLYYIPSYDWQVDYYNGCYMFDDDIDAIHNELVKIEVQIKKAWRVFIDNI